MVRMKASVIKTKEKEDKHDNLLVARAMNFGDPPCIMCVQYRGGDQYRGGCSVPWGDIMSTVGDILSTVGVFSTVGDILSTVGGVQYRGGYHEYRGGIPSFEI